MQTVNNVRYHVSIEYLIVRSIEYCQPCSYLTGQQVIYLGDISTVRDEQIGDQPMIDPIYSSHGGNGAVLLQSICDLRFVTIHDQRLLTRLWILNLALPILSIYRKEMHPRKGVATQPQHPLPGHDPQVLSSTTHCETGMPSFMHAAQGQAVHSLAQPYLWKDFS